MEHSDQQDPLIADKESRNWAMFCHLSALSGYLIPFGSVLGPLVVWLIKKDEMPAVAQHGRNALNFQLTMLVLYFICFVLVFLVIGLILLPLVALFSLVMIIIATVKASEGKDFNYPLTIQFIKR